MQFEDALALAKERSDCGPKNIDALVEIVRESENILGDIAEFGVVDPAYQLAIRAKTDDRDRRRGDIRGYQSLQVLFLDIVIKRPGIAAHARKLAGQAGCGIVRLLAGVNLPAEVGYLVAGLEILLPGDLDIMPAELALDDAFITNLMTEGKVLEFLNHLVWAEPGQLTAFYR